MIGRIWSPGICGATRPVAGAGFDGRKPEALNGGELHALCRLLKVATVVVTLGVRGCFISQPAGHASIQAIKGIVAVDMTGAGDAFVGAFAAALAEYNAVEIEQAARFANASAALSVTRAGTAPAMSGRDEIDALLAEQ